MSGVLPGDGWQFEVRMEDGTVYDTPVVGWKECMGGLVPCLVLPGDLMATTRADVGDEGLRRMGILELRLYSPNVVRKKRLGSENSAVKDIP